jgi:hypothetical protein
VTGGPVNFKLATHYNAEFPGEAEGGAKLAETLPIKPASGRNIDAQLRLNSFISSIRIWRFDAAPDQSRKEFLMTVYRTIINAFVAASALLLAFSLHPIGREKSSQFLQHPMHVSDSDLQHDEIIFANDTRNLRRHLRHRTDPFTIAEERQNIRRDWLNIVLDRGPRENEPAGITMDLARAKHLADFSSSDVHRAQTNCGVCS